MYSNGTNLETLLISITIDVNVKILIKYVYHNYDVALGSEITSCIKIDNPLSLVVYRFSGNVMK